MKIGILSMQRVINYGSFLQAYALKKTLEALGHQVGFVDIRKGEKLFGERKSPAAKRKYTLDKHLFKRIRHVLFYKKRKKRFLQEFFPSIGIEKPIAETECHKLVIGSDEVFNCCQAESWGFSLQLLGETQCPAISYAGSFGFSNYDMIANAGVEDKVASALKKLSNISVRDANSALCVEKLTGIVPLQHVDPVLIYDWDKDVKPQKKYKNYILVYAYDNRINDPAEINAIKAFAKKQGKKLISFGVYQRWCDANVLCTPLELLAYFDGADYVITDTFHGTVFSIKRGKKFATLIRDSNRNKLSDLLDRFGLANRRVESIEDLASVVTEDIDYERVRKIIARETSRSVNYLKDNLQ